MTHHSTLRMLRETVLILAIERLAYRVEAAEPHGAKYRAALHWLHACRQELTRRYNEGVGLAQKELHPHG